MGMILSILAVVLIVLLGGFAGYLFVQNNGLQSQLQSAQSGQQGQGAAQTQLSAAQQQVQTLTASNTTLTAQVASLTAANQDLTTNLSFFTVPANSPSLATSSPVSVSGILAAGLGKNTYMITTTYGVKAYVKNSAIAAVATALQPLLGTNVQLTGTYLPGTPNIVVESVNGSSVFPAPAAATTTTTTSASAPAPAVQ
jgi:hypothetical protein